MIGRLTLAGTLLAAVLAPAAHAATVSTTAGCHDVHIAASAGLAGPVTVHGVECVPATPNGALQVLIPGGTYPAAYWDANGLPAYSYVAVANAAGYTTLALDPLGVGQTTHPLSALITGAESVSVDHQVIAAAKASTVDGHPYTQVIGVGHSLGSLAAVILAALHPADLDGLVLTGYSHLVSVPKLLQLFAGLLIVPADLGGFPLLDPGYVTTTPGVAHRVAAFYGPPDTFDPAEAAADEAHRDVYPFPSLADTLTAGLDPITSRAIVAKVLIVDGSGDTVFCGDLTPGCPTSAALWNSEHNDYTAPLATYVAPRDGHDVSLARDSAHTSTVITGWADAVLAGHAPVGPIG